MALPKRTKQGGIFYQGYQLDVASAAGDYPIAIIPSTTGCAVNAISVTPDSRGLGDYFDVAHMDTTGTTGGRVIKQIATGIHNRGGGLTLGFDFASLQMVDTGESLRFTYVNTASIAMPVYITVEAIR